MQSLLDNYYMAKKKAKNKITKPIEETLWESANKLRGAVEPSEYKHVVLSLIFLKYANDKFEARRLELIENGKEALSIKWFSILPAMFSIFPSLLAGQS